MDDTFATPIEPRGRRTSLPDRALNHMGDRGVTCGTRLVRGPRDSALIVLQETQAFTISVFPKDQDPCDIKQVYVHYTYKYIIYVLLYI